jgi:alkylated DNA nucleotide flippase Atl1
VEEYVLRTLVPMGLQVVATSRPEGVRLSACPEYDGYPWLVLDLAPLTPEQQLACAKQLTTTRLGGFERVRDALATSGFYAEVCATPVLLSLVVLLAHYADRDGAVVAEQASDRLSLYICGVRAMLRHQLPCSVDADAAFDLLQYVAVRCQRVFTHQDVVRAVGKDQRLLNVWLDLWRLLWDQHVPVIRVLQASGNLDAPGDDDQLEFRHLSLQEALLAHALKGAPADDVFFTPLCVEVLTDERHTNVARIGGASLGGSGVMRAVLGGQLELPGDRDKNGDLVRLHDERGRRGWNNSKRRCWWRAVVACEALPHLTQLTQLRLDGCFAGGAWWRPLVVGVSHKLWHMRAC